MTDTGEARALELLADRATEGLGEREQAELDALLSTRPDLDGDSFDLAAAAVELAMLEASEPLPTPLHDRVLAQARAFQREHVETESRTVHIASRVEPGEQTQGISIGDSRRQQARKASRATPRRDAARWMGWWAAAALLVVAVGGRWIWIEPSAPPAEDERTALLAEPDAVWISWTTTEDPDAAGAGGDVVWSTSKQTGYMRFTGLPANDPTRQQYQLWIFDAEQDDRYPIDGGVFDVTESGEVVVPIDPKIRVAEPTLFAVTIEKPGGVVVSNRERLVLLATVS